MNVSLACSVHAVTCTRSAHAQLLLADSLTCYSDLASSMSLTLAANDYCFSLIVHRDLKPDNVCFDSKEQLKVRTTYCSHCIAEHHLCSNRVVARIAELACVSTYVV
jgi:serine/threonine protein kinase